MTMNESVARDIPLPLYAQVEGFLNERLESLLWKPGEQIATEAELCEMFGVSRTVVRQALDVMVKKGLLVRQRGKGTFVAREKINESWVQRLSGFHEDMAARGLVTTTTVLDQRVVPAPNNVAAALRLPRDAEVIRIDRVRSVEGSPPLLQVLTCIPLHMCPDLVYDDLTHQSLYRLLEERYGLRIASGKRSVEALAASREQASLLELREGDPIMRIESVAFLDDGRPLEHFVACHRGDRTRLEVEVVRTRPWDKTDDASR